jgi:hypothetical protein
MLATEGTPVTGDVAGTSEQTTAARIHKKGMPKKLETPGTECLSATARIPLTA